MEVQKMSKGSKRRPTDEEIFSRNYERIFGKKPSKGQMEFYNQVENQLLHSETTIKPIGLVKQQKDRTYK